MTAEAQMSYMIALPEEDAFVFENRVGVTRGRSANPNDLLLEIFSERGYPFELKPSLSVIGVRSSPHRERFIIPGQSDVLCFDGGLREMVITRIAVIRQTPAFRFLSLVTDGVEEYSRADVNLGLAEKIARGEYSNVQEQFPDAEHIGLSPEEIHQCLATAYQNREDIILQEPERRRVSLEDSAIEMKWRDEYPIGSEVWLKSYPMSTEWIEEEVQNTREYYSDELRRVRESRQSLEVNPFPAKRMREVVSTLVDRAETFITGR